MLATDRFINFPLFNAGSADLHSLMGTAHINTDLLQVRHHPPLRPVVGSADIVPNRRSFSTNLTPLCHG